MAVSTLTEKERYKFDVITKVILKEMKPGQAGTLLGISPRQVRRIRNAVKEKGMGAILHGLKGKQSNYHINPQTKEQALELIQTKYPDFKPTFATEKLAENHAITISPETTRLWMTEKGLWKPHEHKHVTHRSWRPRKEYYGQLQQFDGSYHLWFENRFVDADGNPIEVCLLAAIDDATGKITKAVFAKNEGITAVFTFWKGYVEDSGKPRIIYLDEFSTYKINHPAAVDNKELLTQFQQVLQLLDIHLIHAHSAQAKGRIERLFLTLQDRLIKEMRLAGIMSPEEGNIFLREIFLPKFNEKFSVVPEKAGDVHRPLLQQETAGIDHIFSVKDTRRVNLDFTIQFKNNWYQLTEIQPTTIRPLMRVTMETWLDQSVHILLKDHELAYLLLPEKPKKQRMKQPVILTTHILNYKPPPNHPWRKPFK